MSKQTIAPEEEAYEASVRQSKKKKKKKKHSGTFGRILRRTLLVIFTLVILLVAGLCIIMNTVFNGPSESARNTLVMTLTEPSATKWIPGLFLGDELVAEIRTKSGAELTDTVTDVSQVVINRDSSFSASDEWEGYSDGIRIEEISGDTYNAYVMLIRDPSQVYMATSTDGAFSTSIPGTRINAAIETEGAIAAINAGAFNDDGTANSYVGSIPAGLLIADGVVRSNTLHERVPEQGFAGFTYDDVLVVAKSMTEEEAMELNIRDGCEFGPVLIMNGEVNQEAYNANSGLNPRTAIGQRADGTVIFLCVDGRQVGSVGASYKDLVDIMVEYGAVNACNMDGGSSTVMMYRDTDGRYGTAGATIMVNSYSLLQSEPRRMPNFWMVRPAEED